jgi:transposase InsO family protein
VRHEHWTVADAAEAAGCSERTAYRWLARHDAGESMLDRSSAPRFQPSRTPAAVEAEIERLRRLRFTSTRIAATLGLPVSTVSAVLARIGLNRLSRLGPLEPPNRYCRRYAGDLVHLDVKKLGRFAKPGHRVTGRGPGTHGGGRGWEAVHVCIDDATRLAYVEVLPNELATTTVAFLERAIAWFAERDVTVRQVMTDNGSPYISSAWATFCAARGIEHIRTAPTGHAPTAKPNASSRPCSASGLTPPPTATHAIAPELCDHGCATTTNNAPRRPRPQDARQPATRRLTNVLGNYT